MIALWIAAALAFAALALVLSVDFCARRRRIPRPSDCLIVLGAKVHSDGTLSHALQNRCDAAAKAFLKGLAPVVIACGGQVGEDPKPEAQIMRAELIRLGVPRERIYLDAASRNTWENLVNARAIMAEHGWQTCGIVTSDYHAQRAMWMARDQRMSACMIAAASRQTFLHAVRTRIRESISWILYWKNKYIGAK